MVMEQALKIFQVTPMTPLFYEFFYISFSFLKLFSVLLKLVISLDFKTLNGLVYEHKKIRAFETVILMIQASEISRKHKIQKFWRIQKTLNASIWTIRAKGLNFSGFIYLNDTKKWWKFEEFLRTFWERP